MLKKKKPYKTALPKFRVYVMDMFKLYQFLKQNQCNIL